MKTKAQTGKVHALILKGRTDKQIVTQLRKEFPISEAQVRKAREYLRSHGIDKQTTLLSTEEAAIVLDVIPRRVRKLCSEYRLGERIGEKVYVIQSKNLIDHAFSPRKSGKPKQEA